MNIAPIRRRLHERVSEDIDNNGRPEIYYREIDLKGADAIPMQLEVCGRTFELDYVNTILGQCSYSLMLDEDEEIPKARR